MYSKYVYKVFYVACLDQRYIVYVRDQNKQKKKLRTFDHPFRSTVPDRRASTLPFGFTPNWVGNTSLVCTIGERCL